MISTATLHKTPMTSRYINILAMFSAFLLGIGIVTSNPLMNLTLILMVICLILKRKTLQFKPLLTHPLIYLPAIMFFLLLLSLLFQHNYYGVKMVGKYQKLLYILPLALFFLYQSQLIKLFCSGFLIANAVILTVSLLVGVLHIPIGNIDIASPTVFKLRITQNFFMALAALLCLALTFQNTGWKRWGYGLLVVAASYSVLFMGLGRTGYVALVVGLGLWSFLTLGNRQRLGLAVLGLIVLGIVAVVPNPATNDIMLGVNQIKTCLASSSYDTGNACGSSMGLRSAFTIESIQLIKNAPILGNGVGGFYYSNVDTGYQINNPHNEYLLQLVQSGVVGLLIFLAWILCCYRVASQQSPVLRNVLFAILTSYMACNFFNSFLLDSSEGHLFMILVAILAGYSVSNAKNRSAQAEE